MKRTLLPFLLLACGLGFMAAPSARAAAAANDLILSQRNSGNTRPVERLLTPSANSLFGFNGSLIPAPVTIGSGLQLSSGVLSATGGGGGGLASTDIDTSAELRAILTDETGTGALVFGTSPTLVTPALGTPSALVLTNATGLPIGSGLTGAASGILTWLATPSSANLAAALTDETGTGSLVFGTSPTLVTPALGTPSALVLTNATGLPFSSVIISGTPTGSKFVRDDGSFQSIPGGGDALVANPLSQFASTTSAQLAGVLSNETGTGVAVFNDSPTLITPALGTPSALTLTNATGLPIGSGVSGLASGIATFLATSTSANLAAALTNETGTGALVFASDPVLLAPNAAMGALAIDVTKTRNTKTATGDHTWTFSATPTAGATFGLVLTGHSAATTQTIPSSISLARGGAAITTFTLPANAKVELSWVYDGTSYFLAGEPFSIADLSTVAPAGADLIAFRDVSGAADGQNTITALVATQIGSAVQAYDADLTSFATVTPSADGLSFVSAANYAAMRGLLDLEAGTDFLGYPTGTPTGSKFLRDDNSWQAIAGGGDALTSSPLSQFAATTSAQLAGVLSNETGTGLAVFNDSPTLITPALGTPSALTLTNATGLPIAGLAASTSAAIGVGSVNLGHASDTNVYRAAAGIVAVNSQVIATDSNTLTLTNKTIDAAATGNVLKFKSYLQLTYPHRVEGSDTAFQTADATVVTYGHVSFSHGAAAADNWCEYLITVPNDIDTSVALRARLKIILGGTDTATHRYVLSSVSVADSAVPGSATLANAINVDFAGDGSGASGDVRSSSWTTLTSWAGALTAGQTWRIRLARSGDATEDASTVTSHEFGLEIEYGATQ